jgi:acyl carrier protein
VTQTRDIWPELTLLFRDFFLDDDIQLHAGMTSRDVVGWDSLNNIALMSAVQQHFRIKLSIRDTESLKNVGDLAACVGAKLAP